MENIAKVLEIQKPKTPKFYMKHWTPSCTLKRQYQQNFNYVDYHIQPIPKIIPSYVIDTTGFFIM